MTNQTEKLRDFLKVLVKEKGYDGETLDIQPISPANAGSVATGYTASVSAPPKEYLYLFAKVVNVCKDSQATNHLFCLGFECERFFYTELAVAFENLYNKNGVPAKDRIYIPKYYGFNPTKLEETIVLENLEAKGYGAFNKLNTFDWEYASNAIVELAKFHAIGLVYGMENKNNLKRINEKVLQLSSWLANEHVKRIFQTQAFTVGTQKVKQEYRMKMQKYFKKNNLLDDMEILWTSYEGGFLIHGEYRPTNLMHRMNKGKIEIVPIDYQTYRLGMLAVDLMYFIWFGSDELFRRDHYSQLLELYYEQLARALLNHGVDINNVYPKEMFQKELEKTKFLGLFVGLTMISPTVTTIEEQSAKIFEMEDILREPSQRAIERINGIVGDYIRWGII